MLELLAAEPEIASVDIARRIGVSKQRVHQIMKGFGRTRANTGTSLKHRVEYNCWRNMIARCSDPDHSLFSYYGGRGIVVCDRWLSSFPAFLLDVGPKPSAELSLDRINNNGNYEPGNCRWATRSQQIQNRRAARLHPKEKIEKKSKPRGREFALDDNARAEVVRLYETGLGPTEIARKFDVSRGTVVNYVRAAGVIRPPTKPPRRKRRRT